MNESEQPTKATIQEALETVIDPEVGVNVYDLGLIYEVRLSDDNRAMEVSMTMTTPACPMSAMLTDQVHAALRARFPALESVEVNLVWDPPWSPQMMSERAKQQLGWSQD